VSTRNTLKTKDTHKLKVKGWKKIFQACRNRKQAGLAILVSDRADFMQKSARKDKDHYILIKGTIQQEDITILNTYSLNIGVPKFINTSELKGTDRSRYNNSGRLQHLLVNSQNIQIKKLTKLT
jgi:hypothetical protein